MKRLDPITNLLQLWREGDASAESKLFELLEHELKRLCHLILKRNASPMITFQTTEVFNELYMRLATQTKGLAWKDRAHFFGIAARHIRQLLIDNIRQKTAQKRQAFQLATVFEDKMSIAGWSGSIETLADAMRDLEKRDESRAMLVDLRFFVGLNMEQVAEALGISRATANRRWRMTKAWLWKYLKEKESA